MLLLLQRREEFSDQIKGMHRLRKVVFKDRLGWDVSDEDGMEIDQFDDFNPEYIVRQDAAGTVDGCVRLLPTEGPTMVRDVFPMLVDGPVPRSPRIWESSRFCLDTQPQAVTVNGLALGTYELFISMIEFGLARDLDTILTVTDVRIERILKHVGWGFERLGSAQRIGPTRAVAGLLDISVKALKNLQEQAGVRQPMLWVPATALKEAA